MAGNVIYTVTENKNIADKTYIMKLEGDTTAFNAPGQFLNIQIEGFYLRRPISVCSWNNQGVEIIYKVLGKGTARMAQYAPGTQLDVLTGLGNGFNPSAAKGKSTLLAGGGVGVPPLYGLAKELIKQEIIPTVTLGFRSASDVFYEKEFQALGCKTLVATEDGTFGSKGYVTNLMEEVDYQYYYSCGPQAMLRSVYHLSQKKGAQGQLSFEERMGCGFGACMGCSCHTLVGPKRVCVDGPVFPSSEVIFE